MRTPLRLMVPALVCAVVSGASPRLASTVSWLGNTFPGGAQWVQQDIRALAVASDGSVYTNVEWDEGGAEVCMYRDGKVAAVARHTHGWGYHGGEAVAVNSRYVFFGQKVENEGGHLQDSSTWPPRDADWFGIGRRLRTDLAKVAPFAGGKGGKGNTLKGGFLVINEVPHGTAAAVAGLCATEDRLYVANPSDSQILVFDAETLTQLAVWSVPDAGQMAVGPDGWVWTVQSGRRLLGLPPGGDLASARIVELPNDAVPGGICFAADGRLLLADRGPSQQILAFTGSEPATPVGVRGGIYAAPVGRFGDLRFNMPRGIGCDGQGNLYVASDGQSGGGGTVLECYAPNQDLRWRLFGLEFVDMAAVDPQSDQDVYTKEEHFRMDYAQAPGREWTYRGYTIDPFRYPEDPRLHIWSAGAWVRRLGGRRFLFVNDMNGQYLQVYRLSADEESETAIPCALFVGKHIVPGKHTPDAAVWPPYQPEKGEWLWQDTNGNGAFDDGEYAGSGEDAPRYQGWWVDAGGAVWQATETAGIRRFPFAGLDANGNPRWDWAGATAFRMPAEFDRIKRLRYDPQSDTMLLGGTTAEHKNQHWKPMGPVICRYDSWSQTPVLRWRIVAPYAVGSQGHSSCEPMGFDTTGDYVFVPYTGAGKELGFTTGHVEVFRFDDGAAVGHLEPSAEIGDIGLQDIRECLLAHRRADGEYLVFLEEDWKAKILLFRWRPE